MKIIDNLFKWFSAKGKDQHKINIGYVLDGEPKSMEDIEKIFKAFQLDQYIDRIKPLVRSKIDLTLTPAEESRIDIPKSKIGGQADLLKDQEWPKNELGKSLSFIGQLNLGELSKFDQSGLLPKEGLLSFFYCADQEAWGFDPKDRERFKVIYTEKVNELIKQDFPEDLESASAFKPNLVSFSSSLSLPGWEHDAMEGLIQDQDMENYIESSGGGNYQVLGYANCVQGPMEQECQFVSNGLYCGDESGYEDKRAKELEKGKEDWILLLQIDSDEDNTGMIWGDDGKMYFWIRKQDLANKNFENVWCILQCY